MFGWEFPPFNSGGLGTACYGLTRGLYNQGVDVSFVLPKANKSMKADFVKIVSADLKRIEVNSMLKGYMTNETYKRAFYGNNSGDPGIYGRNLIDEVRRYAKKAALIAQLESHDVIHAHDWLTYLAGIEAKKISGKPLVVHVHATEFDRSGDHPNQEVYDIEREGMHNADIIISVSNFTKSKVVEHYGIPPKKVHVVHNAVDFNDSDFSNEDFSIKDYEKIVLFLGRITMQKGPDYFIDAAKKALEIQPNIKFIMAGTGDMESAMIEKAANLGISDKMLFTGFLKHEDLDKAYQIADLYVMPSISEPFGITPLEAIRNNTPVLISKQSGVSEVLNHCLKIDFWDIDQMVNKMVATLRYNELHKTLKEHGAIEIKKFNWNIPAEKCVQVYNKILGEKHG